MSELNLTQIKDHYGLPLTAGFIVDTLHVPNCRQEKRALYWHEGDLSRIGDALIGHVRSRQTAPVTKAELTDDDLGL